MIKKREVFNQFVSKTLFSEKTKLRQFEISKFCEVVRYKY